MLNVRLRVQRMSEISLSYLKSLSCSLQLIYHLLIRDINATIRKATPAQNRLPPVKNHTTSAIMAAGRMNRIIFAINMIITIPMISSSNRTKMPVIPVRSKGNVKANTSPLKFCGS